MLNNLGFIIPKSPFPHLVIGPIAAIHAGIHQEMMTVTNGSHKYAGISAEVMSISKMMYLFGNLFDWCFCVISLVSLILFVFCSLHMHAKVHPFPHGNIYNCLCPLAI